MRRFPGGAGDEQQRRAGARRRCRPLAGRRDFRSLRSATGRRSKRSAPGSCRRARPAAPSTISRRSPRPSSIRPAGPLLYVDRRCAGRRSRRASCRRAASTCGPLALYRAMSRKRLAGVARDALRAGTADGVLLYSPRSAAAFAEALRAEALRSTRREHHLLLSLRACRGAARGSDVRTRARRRAAEPAQPLRADRSTPVKRAPMGLSPSRRMPALARTHSCSTGEVSRGREPGNRSPRAGF